MRFGRRFTLPAFFFIVLATTALIWWHAAHAFPEQIITLPNGHQYRFAGVTYSKDNVPPSMLARVVRHLPNSWARRIEKYTAPRISQMSQGQQFDTPQLFVWFTRVGTNFPSTGVQMPGFRSGPISFGPQYHKTPTAALVDESGKAAGVLVTPDLTTNAVWSAISFSVIPRRSRMLECTLYSFNQNRDGFEVIGKVRFRNPAFGHFPQWEPEPVPAVKPSGQLQVRLDNVTYENPYTNLNQTGIHWPQTAVSYTMLGADGWTLIRSKLSDATGNHIPDARASSPYFGYVVPPRIATASSPLEKIQAAGAAAFFDGVLWPGENAWRVKMEFKRTPGHGTGRQITFANVLLPGSTVANGFMVFTNWETGKPIVIRRNGWSSGGGQRGVYFQVSELPPDQAVNVVSAQTDVGPAISTQVIDATTNVQISIQYRDGATNMDLILDLEKIQTVEFLVKPPQ